MGEQTSIIAALKLELEKVKKESHEAVREQARIQKDFDANRALMLDLERAERMVRVDLEQGSKRVSGVMSCFNDSCYTIHADFECFMYMALHV